MQELLQRAFAKMNESCHTNVLGVISVCKGNRDAASLGGTRVIFHFKPPLRAIFSLNCISSGQLSTFLQHQILLCQYSIPPGHYLGEMIPEED